MDTSQGPYYMLLCIQQWLTLVLDLTVGSLAVILVATAMAVRSLSAGNLGVALVLVSQFSRLLGQCIQAWTQVESSISAVARVRQFVMETPKEPTDMPAPEVGWPSQGLIRFENVVASYSYVFPLLGYVCFYLAEYD
jgi:ATP-binding cassette, subfamily C (CFTR/MRP), member 1